jgi:hypothetical protein
MVVVVGSFLCQLARRAEWREEWAGKQAQAAKMASMGQLIKKQARLRAETMADNAAAERRVEDLASTATPTASAASAAPASPAGTDGTDGLTGALVDTSTSLTKRRNRQLGWMPPPTEVVAEEGGEGWKDYDYYSQQSD